MSAAHETVVQGFRTSSQGVSDNLGYDSLSVVNRDNIPESPLLPLLRVPLRRHPTYEPPTVPPSNGNTRYPTIPLLSTTDGSKQEHSGEGDALRELSLAG